MVLFGRESSKHKLQPPVFDVQKEAPFFEPVVDLKGFDAYYIVEHSKWAQVFLQQFLQGHP